MKYNKKINMLKSQDKIFYGIGQFSISFLASFIGSSIIFYYDAYLGMENLVLIGNAFLIYTVWNFINDPLFGNISDRTKHRLGRKIPYIRYGAIPITLTFLLLWLPLKNFPDQFLFIYLLIILLIFDTFYTIVGVSFYSLLPLLTIDETERASFSKYAMIFSLIGIGFSYLIPLGTDTIGMFFLLITITSVISCLGMLLVSFKLKEKFIPQEKAQVKLKESLIACLRDKGFLIYVIVMFGLTFFRYIVMGGIIYFFEIITYQNTAIFLPAFLIIIPILVILIYFITILDKKIGLYNTFLCGLIMMLSGLVLIFLIPFGTIPLSFSSMLLLLIFFSIALCGFIIYMMYENTLLGRIVDADELKMMERREGMFFGTKNFITKPANSLGIYYLATLLEIYLIDVNNPSASAFASLKIVLFGWPILVIIICIILYLLFPLKGEKLAEVKREVIEKHKKLNKNSQ